MNKFQYLHRATGFPPRLQGFLPARLPAGQGANGRHANHSPWTFIPIRTYLPGNSPSRRQQVFRDTLLNSMDGSCDRTGMRVLPTLQSELRVVIRYKTTDIPGSAVDRARRVVNEFALQHLKRPFSWNTDHIHCSSDFDSEHSKHVWIMCDFNVKEPQIDVETIPVICVQVHYGEETTP
jgi:hypothetical protein